MIQLRKTILLFLLVAICFFNVPSIPSFAEEEVSSELADFLCDVGIKFYKKGQFAEALKEFQTVLGLDPNNKTAKQYIDLIDSLTTAPIVITSSEEPKPSLPKSESEFFPVERIFPEAKKDKSMDEFMLKMDKEMKGEAYVSEEEAKAALLRKTAALGQEALPKILVLDVQAKNLKFPLEIEQQKSVIIRGNNVRRFLITQPDVLTVERINANEIKFTGASLGYTYAHIWDAQERWTLEFLTIPLRPIGQTLEEEMRKEKEASKNFKLRYIFDWRSFQTGRRINSLKRSSYSLSHSFGLAGPVEIPYGNLDFGLTVGVTKETTSLNSFTLGLAPGKIGPFQDFYLHTFDFSPGISNLAFSNTSLRGVMLNSPAFDKQIDYTVFWGREGGGKYAGLSPGLSKIRNSFLSGLNIDYLPEGTQRYKFSVFHGWGRQRAANLNAYGYDFGTDYKFDKWGIGYETGYDSENFAHLLKTNFRLPKLIINNELRDTDKAFRTMTGLGSKTGELGLLNSFMYQPLENLFLGSRIDIYRDRLFPNPNDVQRFNEDFDVNANLRINTLTNLNLNYGLQNDLGRISPYRSHSAGIGVSRNFNWVKDINTHINYDYRRSVNFSSASFNHVSNRVFMGVRLNLIRALNYFFDQEFRWIYALSTDESSSPRAFQTGLDWSDRIFNSPISGSLRLSYRNEENTLSPFSFMSGEDYIESSGEISYRPNPEVEIFVNTRMRNVWADNPKVNKRVEMEFNSGARYVWDTGLHWESVGTVEGYVFKDLNSDGLRQRDEAPIEGIKILLGNEKSQITDIFGYYKFKKVRARKVYVSIDTTTIPAGFVLTVPQIQEANIAHWQTVQINFGIVSRTEISGMVFLDANKDGQYNAGELGIGNVTLRLEDGREAVTDNYGRYFFRVSAGKYRVSLNLSSLPSMYIPTVPIFREVELSEGMVYNYNIPVKKIGK